MSVTPKDVAEFMITKLEESNYLYQEYIAHDIDTDFGGDFTYINENGNLAIDNKVLTAFRQLTEGKVVWDRREKAWRFRESSDSSGRQQEG